ncbi:MULTISPECIES: acyl-CoA thioesterase [unclassified Blastococcus]
MPVLTRPVAARPYPDGSDADGAHAPHYLVVEAVSRVWEEVLAGLGDDVLPPRDVAVVRAAFDYRHEVFVAPAEFEVGVVRVGRTSVELAVRLHQGGRPVVDAQVVLAQVDAGRTAAVPLSGRQRAALEGIAVPAPSPAG